MIEQRANLWRPDRTDDAIVPSYTDVVVQEPSVELWPTDHIRLFYDAVDGFERNWLRGSRLGEPR